MPICARDATQNLRAADMNKYLAEFFGSFGLVFFGTLSIVVSQELGGLDNTSIGIVFGLVVMAMIYAFGENSGAHINPAVTLAFWLGKEFPTQMVIPYILAQFTGGILASSLVFLLFPANIDLGATNPQTGLVSVFVSELIMSLFLMLVIFHVARGSKEMGIMAGIAIGATVALCAVVGGPISGASMNPARSLGPAFVSGNFNDLWIYLTAPVLGMLISIPVWKMTKSKS